MQHTGTCMTDRNMLFQLDKFVTERMTPIGRIRSTLCKRCLHDSTGLQRLRVLLEAMIQVRPLAELPGSCLCRIPDHQR